MEIKISICRGVIEKIYAECQKDSINENGGRLIGFFLKGDKEINIKVCGLIGAGLNAKKSPVSLFQDGEYQEAIFRKIEVSYPDVEHLGNWHTHHVNNLNVLSKGDIETYGRIVNHEKFNLKLFYSLLIIKGNSANAYLMKHFLFTKGLNDFCELPQSVVGIINEPIISNT